MPGNSVHGRHRLERALEALAAALDESGAPWMVIGGVAVIARGVRRMTTDVDAVVQGDAVSIRGLVRVLARHDITPRIRGAVAFAEQNLVLLLRHRVTGVDLDLSFGWSAFEVEAIQNRSQTKFGRVSAPMASAGDLLVFKAMAARPTDIQDAIALVALYPEIDIKRAKRMLGELAALADAPELAAGIEQIVARAHPSDVRPPLAPRKKKRPAPSKRRN